MKKSSRGFTLLELIIAGAMIAVLTAFSIPAYQHHVLGKNRALARTTLTELALLQEAYALQHDAYATSLNTLLGDGHSNANSFFLSRDGTKSMTLHGNGSSVYEFAMQDASHSAYTLNATAVGTQVRDRQCKRLALDSKGQRSAVSANGEGAAACWQ